MRPSVPCAFCRAQLRDRRYSVKGKLACRYCAESIMRLRVSRVVRTHVSSPSVN